MTNLVRHALVFCCLAISTPGCDSGESESQSKLPRDVKDYYGRWYKHSCENWSNCDPEFNLYYESARECHRSVLAEFEEFDSECTLDKKAAHRCLELMREQVEECDGAFEDAMDAEGCDDDDLYSCEDDGGGA